MAVKTVSIIPARGGSKGIPGKNIKLLNSIPLIAYTIKASLESPMVDRTIVSTDNVGIGEIARNFGAEVIKRPPELATDDAGTEPVIDHVIKELEIENCFPKTLVLLQPTSPLRNGKDITNALETFFNSKSDTLLSVCPANEFLWKNDGDNAVPINYDFRNRPRRQELKQFRENGAIYIFNREGYLKNKSRLFGKVGLSVMEASRSVEIDDMFEFAYAENFLKEHGQAHSIDKEVLKSIKLLAVDVDGTMTDGGMYYTESGDAMKLFNTGDGMGLELIRKVGVQVAIITKENSPVVLARAAKLKIEDVFVGIKDKVAVIKDLADKKGIDLKEVCYIGDDVNDVEIMKHVGLPVGVSNSAPEVKAVVRFLTTNQGGRGAVREVCDMIRNARR